MFLIGLLGMLAAAPAGAVEVTDGPTCPARPWIDDCGPFEDTYSLAIRMGLIVVRHEDGDHSFAVLTPKGAERLARASA